MSTAATPRKGRPTLPESERASVAYNVRLTAAQHAKVQRLGGAQWIRDRIDRAKEQDGECGEPCQPCTVAEMHAGIDRQTAALVEAGKLLQGTPLDAIYAEADRLGCRLPSGDSPEGYSITLKLAKQIDAAMAQGKV